MIAKLFEVRDRMTFIPVLAVQFDPANDAELYLARRAGYGPDADFQRENMLLLKAGHIEDHEWLSEQWRNRTMKVAHQYIENNFDKLSAGDVVDVEFIRGETTEPKLSERLGTSHAP